MEMQNQGPFSRKNLKSTGDLEQKTMVAKVISELKSVSGLQIFPETGHCLGPQRSFTVQLYKDCM